MNRGRFQIEFLHRFGQKSAFGMRITVSHLAITNGQWFGQGIFDCDHGTCSIEQSPFTHPPEGGQPNFCRHSIATKKTSCNFFAQRAPKGVRKMGAGVTVNPRTGNPKRWREEVIKLSPANTWKNFHSRFGKLKPINVTVPPGSNNLM